MENKQNAEFRKWYDNQYSKMVELIVAEITQRQKQINTWLSNQNAALSQIQQTRRDLILAPQLDTWGDTYANQKTIWLTEDQYKILCSYKREDEYSNSNYISDGLSDSELINKATQYYEEARKELLKLATHKHTFSSTLLNLLVMQEFQPIVKHFELGNFIRIRLEDKIYRLRLTSYKIDFDDLSKIDVDFSTP